MSETPQDASEHNAYQVAPEKPGEQYGYRVAKPDNDEEGYTSENILKRDGEDAPWGRTPEGQKGDHPDA